MRSERSERSPRGHAEESYTAILPLLAFFYQESREYTAVCSRYTGFPQFPLASVIKSAVAATEVRLTDRSADESDMRLKEGLFIETREGIKWD